MPINKKGAPARSSRPVRATAADAARKSGSISPKHRGYRADEAAPSEREPKKRWSSDERAARGHSEQRPRGAAGAGGSNSARVGRERVERSADGRPNWEPKRAYDGRPTRSAAPRSGRLRVTHSATSAATVRSARTTTVPPAITAIGMPVPHAATTTAPPAATTATRALLRAPSVRPRAGTATRVRPAATTVLRARTIGTPVRRVPSTATPAPIARSAMPVPSAPERTAHAAPTATNSPLAAGTTTAPRAATTTATRPLASSTRMSCSSASPRRPSRPARSTASPSPTSGSARTSFAC